MTLELLLDGLILFGLAGLGAYCLILHRRLSDIRRSQGELAEAIAVFDAASRRAEGVLKQIDQDAQARGRVLDETGRRAEAIATELSVMIGAGDRVAARIEAAVRDVKAAGARRKAA